MSTISSQSFHIKRDTLIGDKSSHFIYDLSFKRRNSLKETCVLLRQQITNHRNFISMCLLLLLLFTGILTFTLMGFQLHDEQSLPEPALALAHLPGFEYTSSGQLLSCGSTFEEAAAAGCIFDIMTFAWTPPACLDTQVHNDVISDLSELAPTRVAGTWPWWRWSNRTEPLEQKTEILSQYDDIWTDTYYHRAHCLYLWRIMHRASMRAKEGEPDVYVYFRAYDYEHVIHCNKLLNELDVPLTERPATVSRVIGHCVKLS